jgi:exonuclease III
MEGALVTRPGVGHGMHCDALLIIMAVDIVVYRARIGTFHGTSRKQTCFLFHSSNYQNIFTRRSKIGSFHNYLYGRKEWAMEHKNFCLSFTARSALYSVYSNISMYLLLSSLLALCGDVHPNPGPQPWTDLSISHTNIRSIRAPDKIEHIRCELADNFDIVTLSETWLHSNCDNLELEINGFQSPFRKDRSNDSGYGGVMAWVSSNLSAKRRSDLELPQLEIMWLEVRSKNNKFILGVGYRPPSANDDFWQLFQDSLDKVIASGISNVFIIGDFNADPRTTAGSNLDLFTKMNNMQCLINEPTRTTENSSSILDQIITNATHFVKKTVIHPPIATCDHATISLDLLFRIKKQSSYVRRMWDFSIANFDEYRRVLQQMNLTEAITDDVNESCNKLTNSILSAAKICIPSKLVTVRHNDKPWFNNYLRRLLRSKNRYHMRLPNKQTPMKTGPCLEHRGTFIIEKCLE